MFILRKYQEESKQGIYAFFQKGLRRILLILPTGGGKTVTFVDMVVATVKNKKRAMILCDRKELISQALVKVKEMGLSPTVIAPGYHQMSNNVYLASVDTLRRRELPEIDLLIVDEAHKQTFEKMLHKYIEFCNPYIIGATATPIRTGSQKCLSEIYEEMVDKVSVQDLIDMGSLVSARTFAAKEDFSSVATKGQDFDVSALFEKFNKAQLYDGVIDNYIKFGEDRKALCFNVNVEHSVNMVDAFRAKGITAEHIDGNTPQRDRDDILLRFKLGRFKVLCNCAVLTTGYDEPSIECIIVNRATMSLALWLQMCGRGSRLFKTLNGVRVKDDVLEFTYKKKNFIIIDQGANVYRHGLWQSDREWSLFKKPKGKTDGVAPVKLCESCQEINPASARVCKTCGAEFKIKEKKLKEAEFVEVKDTSKRGMKSSSKPDPLKASVKELNDYAKEQGYKPGWGFIQKKIANEAEAKRLEVEAEKELV